MPYFKKKPVTIEADQWFDHGDHPKVRTYNNELGYVKGIGPYGWIETIEGGHIVTRGDWIIKGVQGEFYPCKPDIFELTYEPV